MTQNKKLPALKIALAFCFLIAFAFSIKSFREPDLWWQIRTGEWIIEHKEVPTHDVFSYTFENAPWINIKWGFEVLAAIISNAFGPESVFILQAVMSLLILLVLFKFSRLLFKQKLENSFSENNFLLCFISFFLIAIVCIEYRINGRPEMFSHFFTILFIYLLEKNKLSSTPKIYLLPLMQMLWANLHEAFGIGIVLILIYLFVSLLQLKFAGNEKKIIASQSKHLTVILFLSIAAVCINPNGINLLLRPLNIFGQLQQNKFTTELVSFTDPLFWKKESYIGLLVFVIACVGFFSLRKDKPFLKSVIIHRYFALFACMLAFLFLSLSAYRNWAFLVLVSFPFSVLTVSEFFTRFNLYKKTKAAGIVLLVLCVSLYISIVTNSYYKLTNSRDNFGLEVISFYNPVDASDFIKKNILPGKKCFSDYLTSSFLLHKLQPHFKTYIDLRDLDIFPPEFFKSFFITTTYPSEFLKADSAYGFEYAVIYRPQFNGLHRYLYNDSIYACTYVDPVVAIYQKTDSFSRGDIFSECNPVAQSDFSKAINRILNPFYKSYNYSGINNDYLAASYYLTVRKFDLAFERAQKCMKNISEKDKAFEMMGQVYYNIAASQPDNPEKKAAMENAETHYRQALRLNKKNATAWLGIGAVHFYKQNYKLALSDFETCISYDNENLNGFLFAAECCKQLLNSIAGKDDILHQMIGFYKKALRLNPDDTGIEASIGLAYCSVNNCTRATKYLSHCYSDRFLDPILKKEVENCLNKCK